MGAAGESAGERIRRLRQARGMSQAALAAKLGVSQNTVTAWELDKRPVRAVSVEPLARALGVDVSDLYANHPAQATTPSWPREAALQDALLQVIEHAMELAINAGVAAPEGVAARLSSMAAQIWAHATPASSDVVPQTDAAKVLGVTRQAVHRLVAEGRVTGYPNPFRADRAPMVSLAEVRAVMGHHATREAAAPDGDSIADRAPEAIRPLNPHAEDADTTSGGSPLPVDPTGPVPPSDGEIADPPWLNEETVRYNLIHYSAAATGEAFLDMPISDQEALIEANMRALRETWRKWSPEQRAEAWAAFHARQRQEHPPKQG